MKPFLESQLNKTNKIILDYIEKNSFRRKI